LIPLEDIEARCFKEPNSGCWLWEMSTGDGLDTYGRMFDKQTGKILRVHRAAWQSANGPIPAKLQVLHKCDTPSCCRPSHLFLGTDADNRKDMSAKGRSTFGHRAAQAKLTNERALTLYNDPRPYKELVEIYQLSMGAIGNLKTGRTWSKVTGADRNAEGGQRRRASTLGLKAGRAFYKNGKGKYGAKIT
jgi:hypothetical protein